MNGRRVKWKVAEGHIGCAQDKCRVIGSEEEEEEEEDRPTCPLHLPCTAEGCGKLCGERLRGLVSSHVTTLPALEKMLIETPQPMINCRHVVARAVNEEPSFVSYWPPPPSLHIPRRLTEHGREVEKHLQREDYLSPGAWKKEAGGLGHAARCVIFTSMPAKDITHGTI